MKIFALYTNVELSKKPDWLDEFLGKYQPRGLHVTLKQPCFIKDEEVPELKRKVSDFFSKNKGIRNVVFDTLSYNSDRTGAIMLCADKAEELMKLQKDLCSVLSEYHNYVEKEREEYEIHFRPHITIGDEIPEDRYEESLEYLKNGCYCEGEISEVVLAVVNDMSTKEAINSTNKTLYHLLL